MTIRMLLLALLLTFLMVSRGDTQLLLLHTGSANQVPITGAVELENGSFLLLETGGKMLR